MKSRKETMRLILLLHGQAAKRDVWADEEHMLISFSIISLVL
jgi:hypothetical protein